MEGRCAVKDEEYLVDCAIHWLWWDEREATRCPACRLEWLLAKTEAELNEQIGTTEAYQVRVLKLEEALEKEKKNTPDKCPSCWSTWFNTPHRGGRYLMGIRKCKGCGRERGTHTP